jgi:hypothetical protein
VCTTYRGVRSNLARQARAGTGRVATAIETSLTVERYTTTGQHESAGVSSQSGAYAHYRRVRRTEHGVQIDGATSAVKQDPAAHEDSEPVRW